MDMRLSDVATERMRGDYRYGALHKINKIKCNKITILAEFEFLR